VNTPGNGATTFSPLLHASWNGFTPTDLVFPSFLFAVGNAMSFVMKKWEGLPESQVLWKIIKRTFIIFLLGYLMYWFPFVWWNEAGELVGNSISKTRIFGVLQRIALCYGITAIMIYYLKPRISLYLGIVILFVYWILLYAFGGNDPMGMQTNVGFFVDKWLIGEDHMYHGEGVAFDPEGFLSTMPAIANVIGGFWVGKYLQEKGITYETLSKLLIIGALLGAYCWNLIFPINKKLWTSSYVLHTVGLDCIIIAIIIYVIDFKKRTQWTYFFEVFGRNPIVIYLLSELGAILLYFFRTDPSNPDTNYFRVIYNKLFAGIGGNWGSLAFALSFMMICWLVGYLMDKKKWYVKI
jgi:predicted acyltransferase